MDSFGRVIAIMLVCILIFIFPLQYLASNQEMVLNSFVEKKTREFADEVMLKGHITLDMYNSYLENLDTTGQLYDIELVHSKLADAVSSENAETVVEEIRLCNVAEDISHRDGYKLLGNAGVSVEPSIELLATHTHTDACYNGTLHSHDSSCYTSYPVYHSHTGSSTTGGGCYGSPNYHTHNSGCYTSSTCGGSISHSVRNSYDTWCSRCGKYVTATFYDQSCNKCGWSAGGGTVLSCGHINTLMSSCSRGIDRLTCTINTTVPVSYSLNCGKSTSTVEYYNNYLICGKTAGSYYNGNTLVSPICNTVVVSITATNPSQSIIEGGTIVTTATAAYLDGHTGTVSCTASGFNSNTIGNQTVTLTYNGLVGNAKTTGTRTCTINVTVLANKIPVSLTVVPSSSSVYNGSEPTYTVVVTYSDNTTKTLTSGQYTKTGWSSGPGTKTVVFGYTENSKTVTKSVTITVLPNVSSLTVTPSVSTVYNGAEPSYTVVVTYENNATKTLTSGQYTKTGWSSGPGTKTVVFSYTENSKTVTKSVTITVLPNALSLTVTPSVSTVYNGAEPSYTVVVIYENNSTKTLAPGQYTKTGWSSGAGTKTVTFSYTENGKTVSTSITIIVKRNLKTCVNGHTYELDDYDTDAGCPICRATLESISISPGMITVKKGGSLTIKVTGVYLDGHTELITSGWTSNFNSNQLGNQLVTVTYKGKSAYISVTVTNIKTCPICGTDYQANADGSDPGCPICSKEIISITATPDTQVIHVGSSISLDVTATYRDGHRSTVLGWTSSLNPFKIGKQTVIVYYLSKSTAITVIVESETETTCPICETIYNPIEYPNGCPICSQTIEGIEARLRDNGTQVQYGSELNLYIILKYRDNHREIAYSDWSVEGYRPDIMGMQTILVKYKEFSTTLTIEIINSLMKKTCPNGHVYYLNADGSDPGCPYCNQDTLESVQSYLNCIYTDDILNELYNNGIYYLDSGDYITIIVSERRTSIYRKLKNMFFIMEAETKKYSYGGMVGYGKYI